jgi:hypothetical protein
MDSVQHAPSTRLVNRVASLVCDLAYLELLTTPRQHLGLERQPVELALLVQGSENFIPRPDFYPLTRLKAEPPSLTVALHPNSLRHLLVPSAHYVAGQRWRSEPSRV